MVRSMYSGVAGMKAHQTKMDVIGNNIANVNTYGFKAGRVAFQDIYYQTMAGASAGSSSQGGTNPSQVGYGSKIGNVDTIQTRSTFSMTDNGMDMAIAGEGFFQVQDIEGNIFYTRAGMLRFDRAGNLVDPNGNFVLGVSGNPLGVDAGKDKIQIQLPNVEPKTSNVNEKINGLDVSITASEKSDNANVTLNFVRESLADGQLFGIKKEDITNGAITVRVNENTRFNSIEEFNNGMNAAIKEANGGANHPAGKFTINLTGDKAAFPAGGLTGGEIVGRDYDIKRGKLEIQTTPAQNDDDDGGTPAVTTNKLLSNLGITFDSVSAEPLFKMDKPLTFENLTYVPALGDDLAYWTIKATGTPTGGSATTYEGKITSLSSGKVELKGDDGDRIIMNHPGTKSLESAWETQEGGTSDFDSTASGQTLGKATIFDATPSTQSKDLGLSSKPMVLKGGTKGGEQTAANLTSVSVGPDGVIEAIHPQLGKIMLGRIDLVTFTNPEGLEASGNSYFVETSNSGSPFRCEAGRDGSGKLAPGSLELSNVDLSKEFSDMIVTQRGFQANSRLITVSDEMLTELVNLKR